MCHDVRGYCPINIKDIVPIRSKIARLLRILGKSLLTLLLLALLLLLLIHIPAIQQLLTRKAAAALSDAFHSEVQIEKIRFSLLGNLEIKGLDIKDSLDQPILHAGQIKLETRTLDLLQGHWKIENVWLKDIQCTLVQSDTSLNISPILDAFSSPPSAPSTPSAFKLDCEKLMLENVLLKYTSHSDSFSLTTSLHQLQFDSVGYGTLPDRIHAAAIRIDQPQVQILMVNDTSSLGQSGTPAKTTHFIPDFGLGMAVATGSLVLTDGIFAMDNDSILIPSGFDPDHIHLEQIQLDLGRTVISPEWLLTSVDSLSLNVPGYGKQTVRGTASMTPSSLSIDGLHVTSAGHQLEGVIKASYVPGPGTDTLFKGEGEIIGQLVASDLGYLLGKDYMPYLKDWTTASLAISGTFTPDHLTLESASIATSQSRITGSGSLAHYLQPEQISWKDFRIKINAGQDLRNILNRLSGNVPLPPSLSLDVMSTGNPDRMAIDGRCTTTWGTLQTKGQLVRSGKSLGIDMSCTAQHLEASHWTDLPWLGPANAVFHIRGSVGSKPDIQAEGDVSSITLYNTLIHDISISGRYVRDTLTAWAQVRDSLYTCQLTSITALTDTMQVQANVLLDAFQAGRLTATDSTIRISGEFDTKLKIGSNDLTVATNGRAIKVENQDGQYTLDSMSIQALRSKQNAYLVYHADDADLTLEANFDPLEDVSQFSKWPGYILKNPDSLFTRGGIRTLNVSAQLLTDSLFHILGFQADTFSGLTFDLNWSEPDSSLVLISRSGTFSTNGLTTDSLNADVHVHGHSSMASASLADLKYNTKTFGNLSLQFHTPGDTITSQLLLQRDSIMLLRLNSRIVAAGSSYKIYPDTLHIIETDFGVNPSNPVEIKDGHFYFKDLAIHHDDMHLMMSGDSGNLNMTFDHINLSRLNEVLFPDSAVIQKADLNGHLVYAVGKHLDLEAGIDSLVVYDSKPFALDIAAHTDLNEVPFNILLTNETNTLELQGKYQIDAANVDARLQVEIPDVEVFSFLTEAYLDTLQGTIRGTASISGHIDQPDMNGTLYLKDMIIGMKDPGMNFRIPNDSIAFNHNELRLDSFRLFDRGGRYLTLTGMFKTPDYSSYTYDLNVNTAKYALMDNANQPEAMIKGRLMIGTDTRISGNTKDTYVTANLNIQDSTSLIYTYPSSGTELTQTEGIIEFVDPAVLADTNSIANSGGTYDSLLALLPDFTLQSKVNIDNKAKLKIIIDSESGDYLEAAGGGQLVMGYDRSGNLNLAGTYTVVNGAYSLSFYDLVKKNFTIVPGSSITWSGNPKAGALHIEAAYKVSSNSIGLIGHEIGESEKSIYKRSLEYTIGIHIEGTLEKPNVYFTLDLPDQEKTNYPVLANKLDRLKQPEFQSELNKQVFGLLVLGGFLPESSGSDVNSNQVATTALYNSVNSVLAAQLNRFAGQYLKGFNIDVGIQSYSDYSTPGSKTQTAMDFRVSKSVLDDRLSFEVGGDFDISADQSGSNTGNNYRGDVAIIYDLTGDGDKKLKLFNNESYDIVYQEIRNTGISLIFIRDFNKGERRQKKNK